MVRGYISKKTAQNYPAALFQASACMVSMIPGTVAEAYASGTEMVCRASPRQTLILPL